VRKAANFVNQVQGQPIRMALCFRGGVFIGGNVPRDESVRNAGRTRAPIIALLFPFPSLAHQFPPPNFRGDSSSSGPAAPGVGEDTAVFTGRNSFRFRPKTHYELTFNRQTVNSLACHSKVEALESHLILCCQRRLTFLLFECSSQIPKRTFFFNVSKN